MITIHPSSTKSLTNNGIGSLSDYITAKVTEELNGMFELELVYPVYGIHYSDITMRRIIYVKPNPHSNPQPFRIYSISKPINRIVTIYAAHVSYDLSDYPVSEFTSGTANDALWKITQNSIIQPFPFTFTSSVTSTGQVSVEAPRTARSIMGSNILRAFGGEYEFDGWTVNHRVSRGIDRGMIIKYGKNLTDIKQDENIGNVYTGVYPYWIGSDADGNKHVVKLPEKIVKTPGTFDFERILPLDMGETYYEKPTEAQIRDAATRYINNNKLGIPEVSIDISFVLQTQSTEYSHLAMMEDVRIGDTVKVDFTEAGILATAKCIKTIYDVRTNKYDSTALGDAKSSLSTTISDNAQTTIDKLEQQKIKFDAEIGNIKIGIADIDILIAEKASIKDLEATNITVQDLVAKNVVIENAIIDKADIKDLDAINAKIENLEVEDAKINNAIIDKASIKDLDAVKITVSELDAKTAKIEHLEAINIQVGNLQAEDAKINNALIEKADIAELDAVNAQIDNLEAGIGKIGILETDLATIKTLVNGNLTSDNIHSLILTAEKVTVEDAFIKSAMIDSLDVSKLNAGDISTNKFKIKSDSGNILLSDNTMLIADDNQTVRVQVGKDASGDYNMYVWDIEGNLMFDATGITSDAIKDKIIRDDMISDNANISGDKINISSVVTNINEGSTTINSTKVMLDSYNQTLDIGFKSITNKVDGNTESISNNTTNIGIQQGKIESLISNTTITKDGVTTQLKDEYNATVLEVDSMKSTISRHTTQIDDATGKVEAVQTQTNDIQRDLNGTISTVGSHSTQISGLEKTTASHASSISQLNDKIEMKVTGSEVIEIVGGSIQNTVKLIENMYATNDNPKIPPTTGWSTTPPTWESGIFIWTKVVTTLMSGTTSENDPICITGSKGDDAVVLNVISSNGHMFKNTGVSTTLTVELLTGEIQITSSKDMYSYFGVQSKLIWQLKRLGENFYKDVPQDDPRMSDNGFIFTLTVEDVLHQTMYRCLLDC